MKKFEGLARILLKAETDHASVDQRPHMIVVVRETPEQWEGYLVQTSDGEAVDMPVFGVWPKYAWKLVAGPSKSNGASRRNGADMNEPTVDQDYEEATERLAGITVKLMEPRTDPSVEELCAEARNMLQVLMHCGLEMTGELAGRVDTRLREKNLASTLRGTGRVAPTDDVILLIGILTHLISPGSPAHIESLCVWALEVVDDIEKKARPALHLVH